MKSKSLAYDAYQELADHYAAGIDRKPHNAFYEWPAMEALWPELNGKFVLDAGCGPGVYAERLLARGAQVISVDVSDRMIELARERVGEGADLRIMDLTQFPLSFEDEQFDFINAPLFLDYIADWRELFREFWRILKPGGAVQFSCGHPAFDAEYYRTSQYFAVEQVSCVWKGFGKNVEMPSFRRSLSEILMPVIEAGFHLDQIVEPRPTDDFRRADPIRYQRLMHRPGFLCVKAIKPI
ncbi:MAG: class I SAM-dependent methyltransferase [Pirellulaceae bacterium]